MGFVAHHKKVPDQCTRQHQHHQHQPIAAALVEPTVMVGQHGHQHRQREVGVVHAALLASPAMNGRHWLPRHHGRDHFALAGDDDEKDIR